MKITVLGCGALGQVWLSALHRQGHDVQGWLRVPQPFCSVNVIDEQGTAYNHTLPTNDPAHLAQSELLLVTLKAWQVSGALIPLLPRLHPDCTLLLLHNGMGTQDELPANTLPILQGVTTHAARRDGRAILHVAQGITHIGPTSPRGRAMSHLAEMLHQALPDVAWHDDIAAANWKKLAVNCVINPLTAIYGCTNGELTAYPAQIERLCREAAQVMAIEGFHTAPDSLLAYVYDVIERTAANHSSMLQDVRAQRHTEIDYITGYLLRRARSHGLQLPENARLFEQIKQKENEYERNRSGLPGTW